MHWPETIRRCFDVDRVFYSGHARREMRHGQPVDEAVGMDFSEAIVAAGRITRQANIGLVWGDILNPPFQPCFDMVMSVGVLHHLPDPLRGCERLAALLKPGGTMLLWLYSAQRRVSNGILELLRQAARPFSNRALHGLSWVLAVLDFLVA